VRQYFLQEAFPDHLPSRVTAKPAKAPLHQGLPMPSCATLAVPVSLVLSHSVDRALSFCFPAPSTAWTLWMHLDEKIIESAPYFPVWLSNPWLETCCSAVCVLSVFLIWNSWRAPQWVKLCCQSNIPKS
jgi:hypothetical protein